MQKIFLDPKNEEIFHRDGYLIIDILNNMDIKRLQSTYDMVKQQHSYDVVASVVLSDLELRKYVNENISNILIERILPILNNYKIILGSFVVKRASSENGKFPLHQDPTFIEEEEHVALSIWCPLVDVAINNGCLGILPGSHRLKNYYRSPCMLPYTHMIGILESDYIKYIPMKKGEVLFINTRMIHGSPPNLSNSTRPVAAAVAIPNSLPVLCCYSDIEKIQVKPLCIKFQMTFI